MSRMAMAFVFLIPFAGVAQTATTSDPFAISLAQKSINALTGGVPINDLTLSANVTSTLGSDNESGTGTFAAKGLTASRVDLNLNGSTRSDVRNVTNSAPAGAWQKNGAIATRYAQHNCWTDAAWFFPALSSLTQTANPRFVFRYIGQEQHGTVMTQHIQVFQSSNSPMSQHLSLQDFYLDPQSLLPLAIAFTLHPDASSTDDVAAEVLYAGYQSVNGIQVPFHIQRLLNGGLVLDIAVANVAFNSGLTTSQFILP